MARINASGALVNGLGPLDLIQTVAVTLTAAQIRGMSVTPVAILPAPPGGGVYVPIGGPTIQTLPGTVAFAGGGAISLVYHGGSISPHASSMPAATLISGTGTYNQLPGLAAVIQPPLNTGIDVTNATAAFTGGGTTGLTGSMIVTFRFVLKGSISSNT